MLLLGVVGFITISLGACREEEQGRLLSFEAGKFLGSNPDKGLSKSQKENLRTRTVYQSGSTAPVGGASKPTSPALDSAQMQQLRLRAQSQSGSKL